MSLNDPSIFFFTFDGLDDFLLHAQRRVSFISIRECRRRDKKGDGVPLFSKDSCIFFGFNLFVSNDVDFFLLDNLILVDVGIEI